MALSFMYIENLSGMTIRVQKNKHGYALGLGMGANSFSWGQRALTKGNNPRPSLAPFTERAAASMK